MAKFVFITGGVVSSLGKGITSAALGLILKRVGLNVALQKLDPYLNVDPGTMSPFQHGEVFVTDDGAETDLDLGHYERYTGISCTRKSNYTSGQIYEAVIARERRGDYLGHTVQVIPHVTDEIKAAIMGLATKEVDVVITEVGGTVGDIEGLPFLEAIRQFRFDVPPEDVIYVHLTLVPYIRAAGEMKTKPTQQSVGRLREIGIQPDVLIVRTERPMSEDMRRKISLFCNVDPYAVFEERDVEYSIYEVPVQLVRQGIDGHLAKKLGLGPRRIDLSDWERMLETIRNPEREVRIAVVGKYVRLQDSYKSIYEALAHAGIRHKARAAVDRVDSEQVEKEGAEKLLAGADGILVPGGFGSRGIEGKILAIRYARENRVPFLGICLGMQCAAIEFARNVLKMEKANSTEFDSGTRYPVIVLMDEQRRVTKMGGTMRLGAYPCITMPGTKMRAAYGEERVSERHRHRYEFNNAMRKKFERAGMIFSGLSPDGKLVEAMELKDHPWFVCVQSHPEFKSRPLDPHPLFRDFVGAALARRKG
ncbi:MAG: CTP synthase [Planctomycetota bacterium]|nr:CTP synthase [Planctomycetota bacterium]